MGVLGSSLVCFLAPYSSPALDNEGLFDSAPFVDTGLLIVIRGNYREPGLSQVKMAYFDLILAFSPDYNWVLGSFCG